MKKNNENQIVVYQGTKDYFSSLEIKDEADKLNELIKKIREFFNLKNVCFLFGSGTSSGAIPTMKKLYADLKFTKDEEDIVTIFESVKVNDDLEATLNILYSARNYFEGCKDINNKDLYQKLIDKIEKHIYHCINISFNDEKHQEILEYYKTFYQKLALRNKDLSRIRIFTTNNDLFNETALDALNIHYINGFSGGLRKFFNPALFNYTLSKRMDTSIDKYEPVENMVYLYKIHGSVNWIESKESSNTYFEIEEISSKNIEDTPVLIYPTPTKQDKSLGSPYVDLFREFQTKLLEPHSVLFVIGYSFSDRHVNDIIYRALATNSTINVVIFGKKPKEEEKIKKPIFFIDDSRIFTINGKMDSKDIHHFDYIVEKLLPNLDTNQREEILLKTFVEQLRENKSSADENR